MDISDEIHSRPPYKTRSASISAPGHSSMETIINPPSGGGGTPESGTPGYRRRRQATRSQSARITAPRNVRKKAMQQQAQQNLQDIKSHCTSEPRLNETETPQTHRRYGSTRRATQNSVNILGRFWSELIDQIEGTANLEVQNRMKGWLKLMIENETLVEPFNTIPIPISKGALPILSRYDYTTNEIMNGIAIQLNAVTGVSDKDIIYPQAASTAIKEKWRGSAPIVTEESTTITQSQTYDTPDGTVTEVRVVEVDKPSDISKASVSKRYDPFATSTNWIMDDSPPPTPASRRHERKISHETPSRATTQPDSLAPRKKHDHFAPSSNWMMDESPSPITQHRSYKTKSPEQLTPVKTNQPTPRKKNDPFAPSVAWYGEVSPQKPLSPNIINRKQQDNTLKPAANEPVQTQIVSKRNDFVTSITFGSNEKSQEPKMTKKTTIQQTHTVETSEGTTTESKTVSTTKTKTNNYQSRRDDAYRSSIGFGPQDDSPVRNQKTEKPPQLNDQKAAEMYQSRRGDAYKSIVNNNNSVRKSNVYLDVPTMNMQHLQVSDPDIVRTFSSSNKGVVNRGDSFRRRRSRSNSLAPVSPMQAVEDLMVPSGPEETFKVLMLGGSEVGKAALLAQFKTSECINAYDEGGRDSPGLQNISIILNGIESELQFVKETLDSREELESADAFLVVYSVVDKPSFQKAEQIIMALTDMDLSRTRPIILVANKIDLARSRAISSQDGRCLACTHRTKFIEVSVGINHNVDELLAGTLTQIRLKKEQNALQASKDPSGHWYKNRNVVRASMKARQMVSWIFGKEDSKFRNCENLQVL